MCRIPGCNNGSSSISRPQFRAQRRHRSCKTLDDRISALPDFILLHILSFLPIEEAIATGLLSKRWQYLWTSNHNLLFHNPRPAQTSNNQFVRFVDKTLVLFGGTKIHRFAVDFKYDSCYSSNVDLWVRFAVKNNADELCLNLGKYILLYQYQLPLHLYTNSTLTKLSLSSCQIAPTGAISWKSLKSLTIGCVKLSEDVMGKILSGSPVLEYLELYNFHGIDSLNITSATVKKLVIRGNYHGNENDIIPREYNSDEGQREVENSVMEIWGPDLHYLDIFGCFYHSKCRPMNVESLVEVNLKFNLVKSGANNLEECHNVLKELLWRLDHVENLTMGTWCIQVLSTLEMKGIPSPSSIKRKHLTIDTRLQKWDLPGIASLLDSSYNLETLVINMAPSYVLELNFQSSFPESRNFAEGTYWTSLKKTFRCLLLHLKTFKIVNFADQGDFQFGFLQFLLKNAMVLERMIISARRAAS